MASSDKATLKHKQGDKVLCYHNEFPYEAKIVKTRDAEYPYLVHYNGWKNKWDEWVPEDRILETTPENLKVLAEAREKSKGKPAKGRKSNLGANKAGQSASTAGSEKSGSASRNNSRTSTPTPSPSPAPTPIPTLLTPSDLSALTLTATTTTTSMTSSSRQQPAASLKRTFSVANAADASDSPADRATAGVETAAVAVSAPPAKKARRSTRNSASTGDSVPPKKPDAESNLAASPMPPAAAVPARGSRSIAKSEAAESAPVATSVADEEEIKLNEAVKRVNTQIKVRKEAKMSGKKEAPEAGRVPAKKFSVNPFSFYPERIPESDVAQMFPSHFFPFEVPPQLQAVFLFDKDVYEKDGWIPVVPARRSVKEILACFLEQCKMEKNSGGVEEDFVKGLEAVFNDFLPNSLLTSKETLVNGEKEHSDCYGIVHLLRLLCFLPQTVRLCCPFNTEVEAVTKLLESFLKFLGNNASEFLSSDEVVYRPTDPETS